AIATPARRARASARGGRGRLRGVAPPVASDWSDLFIVGQAGARDQANGCGAEEDEGGERGGAASRHDGAPPTPPPPAASRGGLFRRLRESMAKTRQALGGEIQATLFGVLDEQTWERLEEALIMADVGAGTTASVVQALEAEAGERKLEGGEELRERLIALLAGKATGGEPRIDISSEPSVIMAVGVNGTGKTTTIGKLAWHLRHELGRTVLLAAADTFRAAASEQLEGWAQRAGCETVVGAPRSDPGAVAF